MGLTHQAAWLIFKSEKLGQPEATVAVSHLTKPEYDAYECWREGFEFDLAKLAVEAQNEAAALIEAHPNTKEVLGTITPSRWTADHYWSLVSIFKGSKYEQLHLSAMFRFQNSELLLDLIRPAA